MKNACCSILACALLFLHAFAYSDGSAPAAARFPLERLDEARRALDAARGDTAAVGAWLSQGKDPDVLGEFDLTYTTDGESLPRIFQVLTGKAAPEWVDGIWLSLAKDLFILLRKGTTLQKVLSDLGIADVLMASYSSEFDALGRTVVLSEIAQLEIGVKSLILRTRHGTFEFEKRLPEPTGRWVVSGTEPLTGWSAKGVDLKVRARVDEHLSLVAVAPSVDSEQISLIIRGIPFFNPLSCAVAYGWTEVIKTLVSAGATTGALGPTAHTALHVAAEWGRADSAETLLGAGVNIDAQTDRGVTPLMAAVDGPQRKPAVLLLQDGTGTREWFLDRAEISLPASGDGPRRGVDPSAARKNREEVALFLLSRGADPAIQRENGENVLFSASRQGLLSLMSPLLAAGIDVDARDARGETALFAAVRANQPAALDLLIRSGASWKLRNRDGERAKDVAVRSRLADCVGILAFREPLHWSLAPAVNFSWSVIDGYDVAWGLGGSLAVDIRLSDQVTLTAEAGYTLRGTVADTADPFLVSTEGDPYFEYQHIDLACLLDVAMLPAAPLRMSAVAGLGFQLQSSAVIRTDSGLWEPIDINEQLESSGVSIILGLGLNGFLPRGTYTGVEVRYMRTLSGEWTGQGGGFGSWSLLIRVGS